MRNNTALFYIAIAAATVMLCVAAGSKTSNLIILITGAGFLAVVFAAYIHTGRQNFAVPSTKSAFAVLLIAGVLLRFVLAASIFGYPTDINCFTGWSQAAYSGGLDHFYTSGMFTDYPPLYMYVLYFLGAVQSVFQITANVFLIKLPAILCDIAIALFLYDLAQKTLPKNEHKLSRNKTIPILLFACIILNPAIIMNSAVWGQIDIIYTLMACVCIYMLAQKKFSLAIILFAFSMLLKVQTILLGPVILFAVIYGLYHKKTRKHTLIQLLAGTGIAAGLCVLLILPFTAGRPLTWIFDLYLDSLGGYPYVTINGFNLYGILGLNWFPVDTLFLGLPYTIWGTIAIAAVCVYAAWLYKLAPRGKYLYNLTAFIMLGVFIFSHGMHERYSFAVPVLLLFSYCFTGDKRVFYASLLTSASLLANQCVALEYYAQWIPNPIMVAVSALNLVAFAYSAIVITKIALEHHKNIKKGWLHMKQEKNEYQKDSPIYRNEEGEKTASGEQVIQEPLPGGFKPWKNPIDRRDKWIMLLISLIYAIVAYVNLGSFHVPETQTYMQNPVIIQLEKPAHISDIRYYAGIGEGTIEFEYSADGINYSVVQTTENKPAIIEYKNSKMYVWRSTETDTVASYIRIDVTDPGMNINEIAIFDADGSIVPIQSAVLENGDASGKNNPSYLVDEQDIVPAQPSYLDEMYFDEIYHGRTAYENIHHIEPYEITHPPLGKTIMTIGLNLFGMTPFGWRCVGTLFGVLMLPLMYVFAKNLFQQRKYAVIATVLMSVDFMHFSQTRIGTIDSYSIFWIMLMMYFMFRYTQCNFNFQPLKKTLLPLFLSGLFFGIGAATKWLCIYAGAGLLVIFVFAMLKRRKEYKIACKAPDKYEEIVKNYKKNVIYTLLWCILFFIVIPGVIYVLSFKGYWHNSGEQWGLKDVIANQKYMLNYHANLHPDNPHPFASLWYTWPLDIRPLLFYSSQPGPGVVSTMSTMGNPFVWIGGLISAITLTLMAIFKKFRSGTAAFLAVAGLAQIVPWVLVSREVFIYHYFATTPFLILILTLMLKHIDETSVRGKKFTLIFVIVCVAAFAVFYPVITGTPVPQWYINCIRWIQSWPFY